MTMRSNKAIVNAAGQTITTAGLAAGGALNPEQAKKFIHQTFEATPLSGLVRHELRSAKTGEIDKIGVGRRLLRKKTENTDDGYRSGVKHGKLEYACTPVRLPWEITEETLRENIEGSNYETIVTNLMTRQIGCDREDLCLNGDERYAKVKEFSSSETYAIGDLVAYNKKVYQYTAAHTAGAFNAGEATELGTVDDADFLKVNDGWVKQFKEGGHVVDVSGINSGAMVLDVFYKGLRAVPDKFNNGSLRWLMSPHRRQEWERYILNQAVTAGGIITDKRVENPASVPVIEVPALPDDVIMLTDPKNLVVVNSYGVVIRKTTEGPEAIYQDKRFYVVHFDFDTLVEELDATAIVTGLAPMMALCAPLRRILTSLWTTPRNIPRCWKAAISRLSLTLTPSPAICAPTSSARWTRSSSTSWLTIWASIPPARTRRRSSRPSPRSPWKSLTFPR